MSEDHDRLLGPLAARVPEGWARAMTGPPPAPVPPGSFAEFTSAVAWGELWNRGQLTVRERRIAVLATLAALGRTNAMRIHTKAALEHGDLGPGDIEELAITLVVYAGAPAGVELQAARQDAMNELDG